MSQTFAEKVFSKNLGYDVKAGEFVEIVPDVAMSHDNTAAISLIYDELGVDYVYNPDMHVIVLDHATPPPTEIYATNHQMIREFARRHRIKNFYDLNVGICHQVLPEEGFALPGKIIVGRHDVREFTCDSLLKNFSMVFQNVYLFRDTILNNIRFGKPDATED